MGKPNIVQEPMRYCVHGFSHDSNALQNAHIATLRAQITSKKGNHGWVLRRMSKAEICFMSALIESYSDDEVQVIFRALENELRGATHRSREMIFARAVSAPVIVPLLETGWSSEDEIASQLRNCLPIFGGDTVTVPTDCADSDGFIRHLAWQRGALINTLVTKNLPHYDADHLLWLGYNYKRVVPLMSLLRERRTADRKIVEAFFSGSPALSEGVI